MLGRFVRGILREMVAVQFLPHAVPRRLSRAEYDRIVAQGIFADDRVELIHGMVVTMSPIGAPHADPVDVLNRHFVLALSERAVVRVQQPFAASDDSEPEPDIALVPLGRYASAHPERAFLIVEVAQTSLEYDRETKAPLYAASGIPEYWVVDVDNHVLEVYDNALEGRYRRVRTFQGNDTVVPTAFPDVGLRVGELFAE